MVRVGPNQDINNPTTIIGTAYLYQQQSNSFGNLLAQSDAQDPSATGTTIVGVSIPFSIEDGSIQSIQGDNIEFVDGQYIYDTTLVSNANIITYVDLAERFREYWTSLNNILDQIQNFDHTTEEDIESFDSGDISLGGGRIRNWGTLGGTEYNRNSYTFINKFTLLPITESFTEPLWDGFGPTSYNSNTYTQLLGELARIDFEINLSSSVTYETDYRYDKFTDASGTVKGASAQFARNEFFSISNTEEYVQIYNGGSTSLDISLSINITATFNNNFNTGYSYWAEIDDLNIYPDPFGGVKSLLSSYVSDTVNKPNPGGTTSFNINTTISVPPNKSAFIGCTAGAGTTFGSNGSVSIALVLNGQTVSHSGIL